MIKAEFGVLVPQGDTMPDDGGKAHVVLWSGHESAELGMVLRVSGLQLNAYSPKTPSLSNIKRVLQKKLLTEEEAYMALSAGHEGGLAVFFNLYYSPLVFYAASIVNTNEVAQEIAAEAFVKLWKTGKKSRNVPRLGFGYTGLFIMLQWIL